MKMHKKSICIGTAQFGQEYGITNKESAVDKRADLIFKSQVRVELIQWILLKITGRVKRLSGAVNI